MPIKEREYFVQSFLSDIKEIIVSQFVDYHYLDHLSFKQIAATINNIYETDITEDELEKHINDEKYLSRAELMIATHKILKSVQKLQIVVEDINNITFSNCQIKKNKKRKLSQRGMNLTWKRKRDLKYIKSSPLGKHFELK